LFLSKKEQSEVKMLMSMEQKRHSSALFFLSTKWV